MTESPATLLQRFAAYLHGADAGRTDAQRVVSAIAVEGSAVRARVGSAAGGCDIEIQVPRLDEAERRAVIAQLAERAFFAASLLAGRLPDDVADAFAAAGVSLVPERPPAIECDCMEESCEHRAAVVALLAEEFERDPLLVLELRGLPRDELRRGLAGAGAASPEVAAADAEPAEAPLPLPTDPAEFWSTPEPEPLALGPVESPEVHAALTRRLGNLPFWRGRAGLLPLLERIYRQASALAVELYRK